MAGELGHRPRMRGAVMQRRERLADVRVARAGEPADVLVGKRARVAPQHLAEHHLRQLGEGRPGAIGLVRGLRDAELQRILQPLPRRIGAQVDLDQPRQGAEQRLTEPEIADEVAADEPRRRAAAAGAKQVEPALGDHRQHRVAVDRRRAPAAADLVRVAVRKRDQITGRHRHGLAPGELDVRIALAQQVVDDHVIAAVLEHGRERAGLRRQPLPRLGELRVEEDRGVEGDHPKDLRQRVHLASLTPVKRSGRSVKAGPLATSHSVAVPETLTTRIRRCRR